MVEGIQRTSCEQILDVADEGLRPDGDLIQTHAFTNGDETRIDTYVWRSDRLIQVDSDRVSKGKRIEGCDYNEPMLRLQFPLTVGSTWSAAAGCEGDSIQYEYRVAAQETLSVGNQEVDVYKLVRTFAATHRRFGSTTGVDELWYTPRGSLVQMRVEEYIATLKDLKPE